MVQDLLGGAHETEHRLLIRCNLIAQQGQMDDCHFVDKSKHQHRGFVPFEVLELVEKLWLALQRCYYALISINLAKAVVGVRARNSATQILFLIALGEVVPILVSRFFR